MVRFMLIKALSVLTGGMGGMPNRITMIIATVVCAIFFAGCGTEMTVRKVETALSEPTPSSAAVLSGGTTSVGGEKYRGVQTLGAPMSKPAQQSEDGKYKIR